MLFYTPLYVDLVIFHFEFSRIFRRDTPSSQVTEDGADDPHNRQSRNEENNANDENQVRLNLP